MSGQQTNISECLMFHNLHHFCHFYTLPPSLQDWIWGDLGNIEWLGGGGIWGCFLMLEELDLVVFERKEWGPSVSCP